MMMMMMMMMIQRKLTGPLLSLDEFVEGSLFINGLGGQLEIVVRYLKFMFDQVMGRVLSFLIIKNNNN
jgi:hypothetical protein